MTGVALEGEVRMDEMFVRDAFVIGAKDTERKSVRLNVISKKAPDKKDAMDLISSCVKPKLMTGKSLIRKIK